MSQKRQTTEEIMAAREAMEEKMPGNVTPLPFADLDLPDFEPFDDADLPSAEEVQKSLEEAMEANAQTPEEFEGMDTDSDEGDKSADALIVECCYCGAHVAVDVTGLTEKQIEEAAVNACTCSQAKAVKNSARMTEKIDMLFGPGSKAKYGFPEEHDSEELSILKQVGSLVAQRKIKGITVTLENGDKAVIQTIKDTTKVRHTKATKAEAEA